MTAKTTSKFTPAQIERMVSLYQSVSGRPDAERRAVIDTLATEMKVSTRSIIGKLSTMKEVTYEPYSKAAPKVRSATNQEMVTALAVAMDLEKGSLDSLVRGSKKSIQAIVDYVNTQQEEVFAQAQADGDID